MTRQVARFIAAWALLNAGLALGVEPSAKPEKRRAEALDIIPHEALGALAIRNISELRTRGDEFIEKTELKVTIRLSEGYRFVVGYLGLHKGLDEQGSAALMAFKTQLEEDSLVLAAPISNLKEMAANFKLDPEDLTKGPIVDRREREGESVYPYSRYLALRGDHLLMGGSAKFVALAAKGKTLREALTAEDRDSLAKDDVLLYLNAQRFPAEWKSVLQEFEKQLATAPPDEAEALAQVAAAAQELKYVVGGLRLDGGLGATVALRFEGEKSRAALARLQGSGKTPVSLSGLPGGNVLAAYAAGGEGDNSAAVARALLRMSLASFAINTEPFISAGHRPNVVGLFGEFWQRLQGSRTALYENNNPERDGYFALVAVLETDNAEKFVSEMTSLTRFVNASGLSLDDAAETIDAKTIATLVADLGHDEYRVRQTASIKLGLIGKPALSALEKALQATDAEVSFRAKSVREQILASVADEREDLLKRDLLSRIKPNFAYFPKQETRSGRSVDLVQIRLALNEAEHTAQLRRLLGPQWSKMRLATVEKRVVVLLGSNTALFDEALARVVAGEKGLEGEARLMPFRSRVATGRTVEFHLSVARSAQLVAPDAELKRDGKRAASLSSFGLSISPDRVRLDLFSPYEEAKGLARGLGW